MKSDIHPELYDVVFTDISTGAQFITKSTAKSDETVKIGDKEYYVIKVEVSSDSHPFYTGKQKLLDTAGRVDKFRAKMEKAKALQAQKQVETVDEEEVEEVAKETAPKEEPKEEAKAETPAEETQEEAAE